MLIGVTRFFRDRDAFARLEHEVLPALLARRSGDEELRVWVAGCATGEEAYSLAMLIDERLRLLPRRPNVKIFASDAHRTSLEIAGAGVYGEEALAEVTPARLERYFVKRSDGYHVSSELRKMIVFAVHNVIKDAPFTRLDLVTCRNLLIYFQPPVQKKVLSLFHFGLKTEGVLFLGPSESPGDLADEFDEIDPHWKIYRKRRDVRLPPDLRLPLTMPLQLRNLPSQTASSTIDGSLATAYDRLLERYMPSGVLVSERRQLVHSFGDASRFLAVPSGRSTNDILELIDGNLRVPLAGTLQRALKERAAIAHPPVRITSRGESLRVKMTVEPILNRQGHLQSFFIAFESEEPRPLAADAPAEMAAEHVSSALVSSLEDDLRHTRESLQATVEELETSNEEMQASNEELVASNEELQSTNEELHSVNQELYTVNAEYQKKIQELTELTDDMDNLLRSTETGTIFLDRDLCIRKFTPQISRAFDLLPHDVGRRIDSFSHNIRYAELLESLTAVRDGGPPIERDVQDQHGRWLFLRILPYKSRSELDGVVLSLIDISPLKQAEARLAQMSALVESSDDAIVAIDLDGRITTWNRGAERLFGYAPDETTGQQLALLHVDPTDPQRARHEPDWTPEVFARMQAGMPADYQRETVRRRKDGRAIDVLLSCSAIRDAGGALIGVSAIARDIGERVAAEQAIAERARLSALRAEIALALAHNEELQASLQRCTEILVSHAGTAFARIWILEPGSRVLELRASAGLYTHLDGSHARVALGALEVGRIAADRRAHLSNDVANDPQIADRDWAERERLMAFAGYPLVVAERVVGVLAMFGRSPFPQSLLDDLSSITYELAQCIERKRAEEVSRRYGDELERTNRELRDSVARREAAEAEARAAVDRRDRYLAILSHELRNPLAAILNAARLLERGGATERIRQQAQGAIGRQSRQMARLLDDLLDVSRITSNKIEIKKQVIDIGLAVREASELLRATVEARAHRFVIELPDDPVHVDGDPARIQQIVVNLLTNAVKYTPNGGDLRVRVARDGRDAVLRVRDNGPGIPRAMRERVFDLFVQLEGAVGNSDGGMGVGLTLVRALVALHGGEIAIEDVPGGGSEFVVRLPQASGTPEAALRSDGLWRGRALDGLRVLVIEDNADIRTTTIGLLSDYGCTVHAAEDGASGLREIARDRPQVALVDIGMPGMNGYEVAQRIRQEPGGNTILLIALTGFGQEEDRAHARAAGFDAHLVKPIDFDRLAATIERLRAA